KEPASATRFVDSVRRSLDHVEGTYGIAVICADCPDELVGARKGSPLIVGVGDGEFLIASDVSAMVSRTTNVVYLNDNEVVSLKGGQLNLIASDARELQPEIHIVDWDVSESELG